MVSETIEAPAEVVVDPVAPTTETGAENPAPAEVQVDAPDTGTAATELQVEVEASKPNYITREEWEQERGAVAQKAASEALELDRRRRQTEGARKVQSEEKAKARIAQTIDTVRTALVSRGYDPDVATDDSVVTAIDRVAQDRAQTLMGDISDLTDRAFDYITAPVFGQELELDEAAEPTARRLAPKIQNLINTIRPQIEQQARVGYVAESAIPQRIEAEIARRAAEGRQGQTELVRPDGTPSTLDNSRDAIISRIAAGTHSASDTDTWREWQRQKGT